VKPGYYRNISDVAITADDSAPRALPLDSEVDAAGQANALETPLLLSSDGIVADVELDQRPVIPDGISKGGNT
jgi:hypothetical protein